MMHEACFCGWSGELADREPVSVSNGAWGLACPTCGHLDCLEWLSEDAAHLLLVEATRRQHERAARPFAIRQRSIPRASRRGSMALALVDTHPG